jgi:hypothetical protein
MSGRLRQWFSTRDFAALIILAAFVIAFALTVSDRDFLSYWTAGQQLIHRANPYDTAAVDRLEAAAGFHGASGSLVMLNPPIALPLALPLGLFGSRLGGFLWSIVLFICLIASVRMIRTMHGNPPNSIHIIGYYFAPAIACILTGQIPLFALLGLTLFLRLHRAQPLWAGAGLWLCAVKPHLFLPFGIALLAWIVLNRRYRLVFGAVLAFVASNVLILSFDPHAWTQYGEFMHAFAPRIGQEFIPCLSVVLRRSVNLHAMWIQFIPAVLGCLWALYYFWKHRREWDWMEHGSLLMLVSILVAPYAWLIDQSIFVPALLHAAYRARSRAFTGILASASALIMIQIFFGADVRSPWNLWPGPFWFVMYLWATRSGHASMANAPVEREPTAIAGDTVS